MGSHGYVEKEPSAGLLIFSNLTFCDFLLYLNKLNNMAKKINSEYIIENNSEFIVTMGTSDKKNPEVIYSIISTYIMNV